MIESPPSLHAVLCGQVATDPWDFTLMSPWLSHRVAKVAAGKSSATRSFVSRWLKEGYSIREIYRYYSTVVPVILLWLPSFMIPPEDRSVDFLSLMVEEDSRHAVTPSSSFSIKGGYVSTTTSEDDSNDYSSLAHKNVETCQWLPPILWFVGEMTLNLVKLFSRFSAIWQIIRLEICMDQCPKPRKFSSEETYIS